ncbi:phage tail tape measure protein [Arvimicrobium flavum]|uniref:phage tail tape measure protein n=1 Tax=Arvimicrobium flavum TaxID=3393320 RepID=UPI00237A4E56|nr:phage tail tape measure protein [Mesorhizobium shangrilense]
MATLESKLIVSLRDMVSGPARGIMGTMQRLRATGDGFLGAQRAAAAPFMAMTRNLLALGAGYVGVREGVSSTIGAAINFESAFADVKKVVDASDEQFANMATTIKNMSRELPITATDLAALYAAAGESNVATKDLKAFAEMASRVGIAFDMSAGDAGDSLAKLKSQLGLSVEETGYMADAINHLSNNMASNARQITAYMLRVGKFAEMGGFHRDQVAAIGSAMISAGAEAEVAGTSMMNVVRKMTSGEFAKKDQRVAAKALGLDLPTLAKQMQKDAPKALKTVLRAISKAPKEKQISLLSQFFGDEARAFAPLVGNVELLDQALASVANRADYAGSAYKEYIARANTTANVLQILRNKVAHVFEGVGEKWLPTVRAAAEGIGDVLDTLDQRVGVFDRIGNAFKGFMDGFGGEGGMRAAMGRFGDMIFGPITDGSKAADDMGRLFADFREWGKSVREFGDSVRGSPIASFMTELGAAIGVLAMSKWGRLFIVAWGISALVGAVQGSESIGEFVEALKGLSALEWAGVGAGLLIVAGKVKRLIDLFRTLRGVMPKPETKLPNRPVTPTPAPMAAGSGGLLGGIMGMLGLAGTAAAGAASMNLGNSDWFKTEWELNRQKYLKDRLKEHFEKTKNEDGGAWWRFLFGKAADSDFNFREHMRVTTGLSAADVGSPNQAGGPSEVSILGTPPVEIVGTPQVTLTNPPPRPNITIHAPITVNGITDLDMIGRHLRNYVNEAASGIQADMGYAAGM